MDNYDTLIEKRTGEVYNNNSAADSKNNEHFKNLASEYGVTADMTGDDKHDLEVLYKAMAGVEKIPESIAGNKAELAKAIAKMDVANSTNKKMEEYAARLDKVDKNQQDNISGLFSQSGRGMSMDFAESVVAGFEDDLEGNAALTEQMTALGYSSIEEWASALNMTVDDFYDKAEQNARDAVTARAKSFEKLNRVLEKTDNKVEKIGETAKLSAGQEEALVEKLVNVSGVSGAAAAE
jgi:hypothetical protein